MRNSEVLWRSAEDVYSGILMHPFLRELSEGSLSREAFLEFIAQDYLYLQRYRSVLSIAAAKAPRAEDAELLTSMAAGINSVELKLHREVLGEFGIDAEEVEPSPATLAYTNYLSSTACMEPFEVSLAAVLSCSWIYLEVGKELSRRPPPDPLYRKWVDQYSGPEYAREVNELLRAVDSLEVDRKVLDRMRRAYRISAIYEYMFWDDAYARRRLPYGIGPDPSEGRRVERGRPPVRCRPPGWRGCVK